MYSYNVQVKIVIHYSIHIPASRTGDICEDWRHFFENEVE